jgi:3-hydroxyisobutyrate dehydrogenase-like beta-hydroxyacid dehydrogenase
VFSLALVAKDWELIHDLGQQTGARMDQAEASRQLVAEAVQAGMGSATLVRSRSSCVGREGALAHDQ